MSHKCDPALQHTHPRTSSHCRTDVPSTVDLMLVASYGTTMCIETPVHKYKVTYSGGAQLLFDHIRALLRVERLVCAGKISYTKWLQTVQNAGFNVRVVNG